LLEADDEDLPDETSYVSIAERSDGLRQFVALLAFTTLEQTGQAPPVLLIDEAEIHLHYDAQADLVQMFAKQEVASKIIYTTHSVGCLPEDLGTGVRLIEPNSPTTSTIRNAFWEEERPGFTPLIFGMGASTLAFVSLRSALVVEGMADVILLPTLLREATNLSYLGFQVVPGLSETNEHGIGLLEREAPRTAYLVDSDAGGNDIRSKLRRASIPEKRIFRLPHSEGQKLVLEDLVDPEVYVDAVNTELHRSHGESESFPSDDLPDVGRPEAVKTWCKMRGIGEPNKRAVAYHIVDTRSSRSIISEDYRDSLRQLYTEITTILQETNS
jgi:predicted ATP-dependent endonuclease of OLD family